jgi:hypothetical protein
VGEILLGGILTRRHETKRNGIGRGMYGLLACFRLYHWNLFICLLLAWVSPPSFSFFHLPCLQIELDVEEKNRGSCSSGANGG